MAYDISDPERDAPIRRAVTVILADVVPRRVAWLWSGRIPRGKLTILDGDPGLGKSAMLLDLAARVSTGRPLPDGEACDRGGVLILTTEDDLEDTVRPRLDAMGADVTRIVALPVIDDGEGERLPALPADLDLIEEVITAAGVHLVIIDPLMAYLGGEINSRQDQDVRRALAPLAAVAQRTQAAVVCIRHLNKAPGTSALYRGGGSIGIIGAARSGLMVAADPTDERRRVLASVKSNLGAPPPALAYHLEEALNGAVRVIWDGPSHETARTLVMGPAGEEERSEGADAEAFLRDTLRLGARPVADVLADARRAGISEKTLRRAKARLRVRSDKRFGDGTWIWSLTDPSPSGGHVGHVDSDQHWRAENNMANMAMDVDRAPDEPADPVEDAYERAVQRALAAGQWTSAERLIDLIQTPTRRERQMSDLRRRRQTAGVDVPDG